MLDSDALQLELAAADRRVIDAEDRIAELKRAIVRASSVGLNTKAALEAMPAMERALDVYRAYRDRVKQLLAAPVAQR